MTNLLNCLGLAILLTTVGACGSQNPPYPPVAVQPQLSTGHYSFSPRSGPVDGGSLLVIGGGSLTENQRVMIGPYACDRIQSGNAGNFSCRIPPAPVGLYPVKIIDTSNNSEIVLGTFLYYVPNRESPQEAAPPISGPRPPQYPTSQVNENHRLGRRSSSPFNSNRNNRVGRVTPDTDPVTNRAWIAPDPIPENQVPFVPDSTPDSSDPFHHHGRHPESCLTDPLNLHHGPDMHSGDCFNHPNHLFHSHHMHGAPSVPHADPFDSFHHPHGHHSFPHHSPDCLSDPLNLHHGSHMHMSDHLDNSAHGMDSHSTHNFE